MGSPISHNNSQNTDRVDAASQPGVEPPREESNVLDDVVMSIEMNTLPQTPPTPTTPDKIFEGSGTITGPVNDGIPPPDTRENESGALGLTLLKRQDSDLKSEGKTESQERLSIRGRISRVMKWIRGNIEATTMGTIESTFRNGCMKVGNLAFKLFETIKEGVEPKFYSRKVATEKQKAKLFGETSNKKDYSQHRHHLAARARLVKIEDNYNKSLPPPSFEKVFQKSYKNHLRGLGPTPKASELEKQIHLFLEDKKEPSSPDQYRKNNVPADSGDDLLKKAYENEGVKQTLETGEPSIEQQIENRFYVIKEKEERSSPLIKTLTKPDAAILQSTETESQQSTPLFEDNPVASEAEIFINKAFADEGMQNLLIQDLEENALSKQMFKLDYGTPLLGRVKRPGNWWWQSVRDTNLGAIREALSNDIYRHMGRSQKLYLVESSYETGEKKLLLQSTLFENFSTFEGDVTSPDPERIEGYFQENTIEWKNPDTGEVMRVPLVEQELADVHMAANALGDRDKWGRGMKNIGKGVTNDSTVKGEVDYHAHIENIDSGKGLEGTPGRIMSLVMTDRMTHQNLSNDGTIRQPDKLIDRWKNLFYKNSTAFSDTSLTTKIRSAIKLVRNKENFIKIFDEYIQQFSEKGDLDFAKELQSDKARFLERIEYHEKVFGNRLEMTHDELALLDNLEKLTSPTDSTLGEGANEVRLSHLRVRPESRQEWEMSEQDGQCIYQPVDRKNKNKDIDKQKTVPHTYTEEQAYVAKNILTPSLPEGAEVKLTSIDKKGKKFQLQIIIPKGEVSKAANNLSEDTVRDLKGLPPLTDQQKAQREKGEVRDRMLFEQQFGALGSTPKDK